MKLIIEIRSGCVAGVYYQREPSDAMTMAGIPPDGIPNVFIVDVDGEQVGDPTVACRFDVEPLKDASGIVREVVSNS